MPRPTPRPHRGRGRGRWRCGALLLLAACAAGPPPEAPAAGQCWVLYGTGPISRIGSTPERLCVRPRPEAGEPCWQCWADPPPVPPED